ncbi:hypothetical protein HYALB_00003103 [Hymenoscyphus albidus]|uniref:Glycosyl transferase family 25 domain-containing protein n=1 Tax=Hymenoscyphus albidus TaxID=595503 RepID=A0A9N9LUK4_9HELO|nr:hypothetical protein HYALB_00003103 [Hymenoscyphus albidus]
MSHHGWSFPARVFFMGAPLLIIVLLYVILRFGLSWKEVDVSSLVGKEPKVHQNRTSISDILNSTLGFQKLFVINLPSRTDRRDAVSLAAAVRNFHIDFIEGVGGDSVPDNVLPPEGSEENVKLSKGVRGSWRSHINDLQEIVHKNISTAMIFEDDVDWDIRVRSQLQSFAFASQVLTSKKLDLQYTTWTRRRIQRPRRIPLRRAKLLGCSLARTLRSRIPAYKNNLYVDENNLLLTNPNDETVPLPKYLKAHPFGPLDALASSFPPHTRVYHRASGGAICTAAYAVSQRGARRLLQ